MLFVAVVVAAVALAVLVPFLRDGRKDPFFLLSAIPLALAVFFAFQMAATGDGARLVSYEWVAVLNVQFAFRLDGLSLLFALLISGIGWLVVVYSTSYMHHSPVRARFYVLLFLFMGAMLGLVLSDNLITLFVFWELTSISSFGLISLESERPSARASATQALFVTAGGGLAMLAGFVLLGSEAGTFQISEILEGGSIADSTMYHPILALILVGAFTKSAQVPFHFWLPNAMEAPTPVSAYLHSATMVKAGVFLLARFHPVLADSDAWFYTVSIAGGLTMVTGALLAMGQTDLKRILAYSTLSILGSLVFLLGIGTHEALIAAIVLLVAHAGYKAALFLCAGIIDHEAGTRDIRELGGLRSAMPVTAACVLVAGLSMSGIPPLYGFIAKESIYEALLHSGRYEILALAAAIGANALMVAIALIMFVRPFLGEMRERGHAQAAHVPDGSHVTAEPGHAQADSHGVEEAHGHSQHVHEADSLLLAGPVLLVALTLMISFAPERVEAALVTDAAAQLGAPGAYVSLWHGFTTELALSVLTVALGAFAFVNHARLSTFIRGEQLAMLSPERIYNNAMTGLANVAYFTAHSLQHGYLRFYFAIILTATVVGTGGTALAKAHLAIPDFAPDPRLEELGAAAITMLGAVLAVMTRSRIIAIIALGIVGYGIALVYGLSGAPDLAITQILVETLIVLMMVFAFYRLPRFTDYSRVSTKVRDAFLAITAGAAISLILLTTLTIQHDTTLSRTLAEMAYPEALGRNIVNVILVDFRALDTLGEITVLVVAALGIVALLRATAGTRSDE